MGKMKKHLLLTPGPTPVPEDIRTEMAKPIIHHRTPEYKELYTKVLEIEDLTT